jgi:hypothetical protein
LPIRIVPLMLLLFMCGCVPPLKKATPTTAGHVHHQLATRANKNPNRALGDAEKDKLFRDFERWRAAAQAEPRASPSVEADQPLDMYQVQLEGPTDGEPVDGR